MVGRLHALQPAIVGLFIRHQQSASEVRRRGGGGALATMSTRSGRSRPVLSFRHERQWAFGSLRRTFGGGGGWFGTHQQRQATGRVTLGPRASFNPVQLALCRRRARPPHRSRECGARPGSAPPTMVAGRPALPGSTAPVAAALAAPVAAERLQHPSPDRSRHACTTGSTRQPPPPRPRPAPRRARGRTARTARGKTRPPRRCVARLRPRAAPRHCPAAARWQPSSHLPARHRGGAAEAAEHHGPCRCRCAGRAGRHQACDPPPPARHGTRHRTEAREPHDPRQQSRLPRQPTPRPRWPATPGRPTSPRSRRRSRCGKASRQAEARQ